MNRGILAATLCSAVAIGLGSATAFSWADVNPSTPASTPTSEPVAVAPTPSVVQEETGRSPQMEITPTPVSAVERSDRVVAQDVAPADPILRSVDAETRPNAALEAAILRELPDYTTCNSLPTEDASDSGIRYFYNSIDLNQDGSDEVIAYLVGSYVCGTGGCTAMIFEQTPTGYALNTTLSLVRNPIIVSEAVTQGWQDLILYVSGGGADAGYYRLTSDGETYPSNPSVEPAVAESAIAGTALVSNDITYDTPAPVLLPAPCE